MKLVVLSLVAVSCVAFQNAPSAMVGASPESHELIAARWYQRARQGQLHYRSTPAGRTLPHTVVPASVRGAQSRTTLAVSPVVAM